MVIAVLPQLPSPGQLLLANEDLRQIPNHVPHDKQHLMISLTFSSHFSLVFVITTHSVMEVSMTLLYKMNE